MDDVTVQIVFPQPNPNFDLTMARSHANDRMYAPKHYLQVMYVGKLVELAEAGELFARPRRPYTEALLSAIPKPDPDLRTTRITLKGEVANPANPPGGCAFHPRCRYAKDICKQEAPPWVEQAPGHFVACHRAEELDLAGAPLA